VTHNLELAQRTERILQMKGGRVVEQKDLVKV
jgi:predicted ABC-type transport system involved in lysophospholipase L1 biosynthesis ATPase subunit